MPRSLPAGALTAERDRELRQRFEGHAIEVLSHQLQVERTERTRVARGDLCGVGVVIALGIVTWRRSER